MKNLKLIAWNLGLLILLLLALELTARLYGLVPGHIAPSWSNFHKVDTLIEYKHFYTNQEGLIIANKKYFAEQNIYINKEGFRSKEFETLDSSKNKILFIGDSFTWGLSATPLSNCFVDIVGRDSSLEVINLGIPVADPAQYEAIARQYIPIIKPQIVFVVLYLGNDIMIHERAITPNKPLYFFTNAGAMMADDDGRLFESAKEAYQYYSKEKYFITKPKNAIEKIAQKSSLVSQLIGIKERWKEKQEQNKAISDFSITKNHLQKINQICIENKCQLKFLILPKIEEASRKKDFFTRKYAPLFLDTEIGEKCFLPSALSSKDYNPNPDGHLTNDGHLKTATAIKNHIKL